MTDSSGSATRGSAATGTLTPRENAFVDTHEDKWVRVTPKHGWGGKAPFVGLVIGWHWYDGVVLHVQPPPHGYLPIPYKVAFEFDTIEVLS